MRGKSLELDAATRIENTILQWKGNLEEILQNFFAHFFILLISLFFVASQAFNCLHLSSSNKFVEVRKIG